MMRTVHCSHNHIPFVLLKTSPFQHSPMVIFYRRHQNFLCHFHPDPFIIVLMTSVLAQIIYNLTPVLYVSLPRVITIIYTSIIYCQYIFFFLAACKSIITNTVRITKQKTENISLFRVFSDFFSDYGSSMCFKYIKYRKV